MTRQITGYLPLSILGGRDYSNNLWRTNLLIKSFDTFFTSPLTLLIVCPPDQLDVIRTGVVTTPKITLQFIDQEDILPGITTSAAIGWYKQQVLSFAVAVKYPTLTILKLDPDLILVNPVDHADFFMGDLTANDMWHMQANKLATSYIYCSSLLNRVIPDQSLGLKWTPFILDPTVVAALISQLASQGMSLLDLATKHPWTETLLYNIVANSSFKIKNLHFQAPLIGSMLESKTQIFNFRIIPGKGIFATLQGFTGITEDQVSAILTKSGITL